MSVSKEAMIWKLYQCQMSYSKIKEILKVGNDRISRTIQYGLINNKAPPPIPLGRRPKVDNALIVRVEALTKENAHLGDEKIAQLISTQHFKVSRSSVNKIHHRLRFKWRPAKVRQALTPIQIVNRLNFVNYLLIRPAQISFETLVFSDESRFAMTSDSRWIWARRGEHTESQYANKHSFPLSCMVWGAIGVGFKSNLMFIENTINSNGYCDMLRESMLIRDCNMHYGLRRWWFMQDGAPCHNSAHTTTHLQAFINLLENWPANSCDLNPIETIWGVMKHYIKRNKPNSLIELKHLVQEVWDLIPQSSIDRLVLSFRSRMIAVVQEQGGSIQQRVRSHTLPDDPNYAEFIDLIRPRSPWTADEDRIIWNGYMQFGNNFLAISLRLVGRTVSEVRGRYTQLNNRNYQVNALLI